MSVVRVSPVRPRNRSSTPRPFGRERQPARAAGAGSPRMRCRMSCRGPPGAADRRPWELHRPAVRGFRPRRPWVGRRRSAPWAQRSRRIRAGTPPATAPGGTSSRATAPAARTAPAPSSTPSRTVALAPTHAPGPIATPAAVGHGLVDDRHAGLVGAVVAAGDDVGVAGHEGFLADGEQRLGEEGAVEREVRPVADEDAAAGVGGVHAGAAAGGLADERGVAADHHVLAEHDRGVVAALGVEHDALVEDDPVAQPDPVRVAEGEAAAEDHALAAGAQQGGGTASRAGGSPRPRARGRRRR